MKEIEKIKTLVSCYQNAIHTQNKEEFTSLWTKEDNNVLISITHKFEGIESIYQDFLIGGIQHAYTKIDLIAEDIDIKFISDELAIVVFKYHTECIRRESNEEYGIVGLETQVVKKVDHQWKLVHIHYSKG